MAVRMDGDQSNTTSQTSQPSFVKSLLSSSPFSVPRESGSAYTTKLFENLSKVFLEKRNNTVVKEMFIVDKDIDHDINFSCIVASAYIDGNIELGKSFFILLLAATGSPRKEVKNIGNEQVELSIFPDSYLDTYLAEKIRAIVAQKSGNIDRIYNADGFVVPESFDIDNINKIKELSKRCEQFVLSELDSSTNLQVTDLSQVVKDVNLIIDVSTNNSIVTDSVGEPIRENFAIDFNCTAKDTRSVQQSLHASQGQKQNISRVGGYMDLLFGPEDPSILNANQFSKPTTPQSTVRYIPRCVITSFDSDSITISRFMLSLYTTLALQHGRNWVQLFRRKVQTGKASNYDDVGFLNIEANVTNEPGGFGPPIATDGFSMATLSDYLKVMVGDNLLYSLDCPGGSPETYYTRVFQLAATGSNTAMEYIYDSLDVLTSGHFSKEFDRNQPIVLQDPIRVLLGHWMDSDGNVRDIRDIDTITVCNMIGLKKQDPGLIVEWLNLFLPAEYNDEDLRLAKMKRLINYFLQDTATFTGTALRVNFNPAALMAFGRSIERCGIIVNNIITPINTNEMQSHRRMFSYDSSAFGDSNSMFRSQGNMNNGAARTFRGFVGNTGRF